MKTKICAPRSTRNEIIYGTDNPNYCYKILPIEKFPFKNKSKGVRRHNCSPCRYKAQEKWYIINPKAKKQHLAAIAECTRKHRIKLRLKINEIKLNSPCVDCEGTFPPCAMDFDHVRGTKKYNVSKMVAKRMSLDKILKEIEKCDVRCANCHRIKTYEEALQQRTAINSPVII